MRGQEKGVEEESVEVDYQRPRQRPRQRCPSLHTLLRRQLLTQGTKMAAAFRKLFRSGDKLDPQYPTAARGQNNNNNTTRTESGANMNSNPGKMFSNSERNPQNMAAMRGTSSGIRNPSSTSTRTQGTSAWGQSTPEGGDMTGVGASGGSNSHSGVNGLNSPSTAKRFFSRHTYLEGSRVGPAEGVVSQHSPKSTRSKGSLSSPPSAATFKKSPPPAAAGGLLNESTTKHMKMVRTRRLMKEYQELSKGQQNTKDPVFTVDLVNDCLYEWKVKLLRVDPDSELYRDMEELGVHHILLSISFPDNFPFHPPFLRVLSPRLEKGFVMEGGAICMELLTPRGWASAYTIEAVIMQFAASLVKGQGRISRKHKVPKEFNKRSAESAFRSLVKTHEKYGWVTPPLSEG